MFHLRFGRVNNGDGRRIVLNVIVELRLRDRALLGQRSVTLDVERRLAQLGFSLRLLAFCLLQCSVKGTRVDLEQYVSFMYHAALAVILFHQVSAYLGTDVGIHVSIQDRDPLTVNRHILLLNVRDLHFRRRRRRCLSLACTTPKHQQGSETETNTCIKTIL